MDYKYFVFIATSKDNPEEEIKFLYNEAIDKNTDPNKVFAIARSFIKRYMNKKGLYYEDYTYTKKVVTYREIGNSISRFKFINPDTFNRPEDIKKYNRIHLKNKTKKST